MLCRCSSSSTGFLAIATKFKEGRSVWRVAALTFLRRDRIRKVIDNRSILYSGTYVAALLCFEFDRDFGNSIDISIMIDEVNSNVYLYIKTS